MSNLHVPMSATRREFLKASSAAAAGASLLGTLSIAQSAHAAGDDEIKIGLVGCGGRGTGAAGQALSTKGNIKLTAVGDAFRDRADGCIYNLRKKTEIVEKIDVPQDRRFVGFDAYQQVINSGVDVVLLATPPGFRPIHFAAAVAAGKHVFMEKPVAVDAPGVRLVLETAKKAKEKNLAVAVGLQRHHQAPYIETIKRLQDGMIGDIVATRVYWNSGGVWEPSERMAEQTEMQYQLRNWYYYNWLCGDHIVEQHIHNLDVSNWLKNATPVRAQGMGGRQVRTAAKYGEIYDHFAVEYEYPDGSRMFSCCRHIPNCWGDVAEYAHGTKGTADISRATIVVSGQETPWRYRGPKADPYQVEHDDLFAAIRTGTPYNEAENGAHSSMTSILGRMAVYSGKDLSWNNAFNSQISLGPKEFSMQATPPAPSVAVPGLTQVV